MYDITLTVHDGLPYFPGERGFAIHPMKTIEQDGANVSWIESNLHVGTHIDVPIHFVAGGTDAAETDLRKFCGPAQLVTLRCSDVVTAADVERMAFAPGDMVLLNIEKNNALLKEPRFCEDYVYVTAEAAAAFAARGAKAVGINYFAIAQCTPTTDKTSHHVLLEQNVTILEGFCAEGVPDGRYVLFCLPLKIAGGNGSPVRAVLFSAEELETLAQTVPPETTDQHAR